MAMATFILLFVLLASPAAFAKDHIVGGDGGWSQSGDYVTWASGETFNVGDNLVFNYASNHGVDVVSKDGYDNCDNSNALESHSDGQTTIKLSKPGTMYFMCPTGGHCQTGMKLAVTVSSSSGTPSTPATGGSPPSSGDSPSTPSGSGTTPSTSSPAGKSSPNAAVGVSGGMNGLVVAVLVGLVAFMC